MEVRKVEDNAPVPSADIALENPIVSMFKHMGREQRRAFIKQHDRERAKLPTYMIPEMAVPEDIRPEILGAWKSQRFSVIAYPSQAEGILCRLSVNRLEIDATTGAWLGGITWDELYKIKNQCGYADKDAVEVFPAEDKLVNVANMRHLWILKGRLHFSL